MHVSTSPSIPMTVGLDLGDRQSHYCLRDASKVLERGTLPMTPGGMRRGLARLKKLGAERLVLEVGNQSAWVSRAATALGLETIVANPRKVRLITHAVYKTDDRDARLLADMGQVRPELLSPIEHRGERAQRDLIVLRTRASLVETRSSLVNEVRHRVKSLGVRIKKCSPEAFPKRAEMELPPELLETLQGILALIAQCTQEIRRLEKKIEALCEESYPETRILRQPTGVGALTALCTVLTLERPDRIVKVRNAGPYVGLAPRRRQSGDRDPELRISRAGDKMLRSLLVNCAHYILGPFGPDSDLKRHGQRIARSGGRTAKKRAVIAVARKLIVLLVSLWRTGEVYEPLRNTKRLAAQAN